MTDYQKMFQQSIRALAAIDAALGIGDDGCGDLDQTLTAISDLKKLCGTCESLGRAVMMDQTAHDMNLVAEKYAHKLALDLECVLADYSGTWYETAMKTLGGYRLEMNAIHERESPTLLGEPLISKDKL